MILSFFFSLNFTLPFLNVFAEAENVTHTLGKDYIVIFACSHKSESWLELLQFIGVWSMKAFGSKLELVLFIDYAHRFLVSKEPKMSLSVNTKRVSERGWHEYDLGALSSRESHFSWLGYIVALNIEVAKLTLLWEPPRV